jgi:hypothetical protein
MIHEKSLIQENSRQTYVCKREYNCLTNFPTGLCLQGSRIWLWYLFSYLIHGYAVPPISDFFPSRFQFQYSPPSCPASLMGNENTGCVLVCYGLTDTVPININNVRYLPASCTRLYGKQFSHLFNAYFFIPILLLHITVRLLA